MFGYTPAWAGALRLGPFVFKQRVSAERSALVPGQRHARGAAFLVIVDTATMREPRRLPPAPTMGPFGSYAPGTDGGPWSVT